MNCSETVIQLNLFIPYSHTWSVSSTDYIIVQYCTVSSLSGNCFVFQQKLFGETRTVLPHVVEAVLSKMHSTQYQIGVIMLRNRVKNKLQPLFPDVVRFGHGVKDVWARGKKTVFLRHGENLKLRQHFFVVILSDALIQANQPRPQIFPPPNHSNFRRRDLF